jgi:hypothetical protein
MAETPYAPPTARVGDPPEPGPTQKPATVRRGIACLWISVALNLVLVLLEIAGLTSSTELAVAVATTAFSVAILSLIAVKANAGRNWARWLFAVIFVLGMLAFGISIILAPAQFAALAVTEQISAIAQFAVQTAALVLLFLPASSDWFRSMRRRA